MKKTIFSMLTLALTAMTMVSCSSDIDDFEAKKENKGGIVLIASNPEIEADTRTLLGSDGLNTMWKPYDEILAVTDQDYYYDPDPANGSSTVSRFKFYGTNTVPSSTANFTINNAQTNDIKDFTSASSFCAVHGDGFLGTDDIFTTFNMNLNSKQTPTRGQFDSSKDILISKVVKIENSIDYYQKNPITMQFKRLTGLLKINIKAAASPEQQKALNGLNISGFTMTTNDSNDDFAGEYTVSLENGDITKGKGKGIEGFQLRGFEIGDGNSIYMSVLPTTIKAGKTMDIVLKAGTKTIKKKVKLTSDVVIPARTVTTLNLTFSDPALEGDPVPGADNKVKVTGNTIDMSTGTGTLFKWHVKKALEANPGQVVIKGGMNALDFNNLLAVLREIKTPVDLDITGVTVIGDKNLKYTEYDNTEQYLINNELRDNFFRGCKLSSVELPNNLKELGGSAFRDVTTLKSVRIGASTVIIGPEVFTGCSGMEKLIVLIDPNIDASSLNGNFYSYSTSDTEKVDLYIYSDWDAGYLEANWGDGTNGAYPDQYLWYGFTWKTLTYVNADGTPIQ